MTDLKTGLEALARSRKFWTAVISTLCIALAILFHLPDAMIATIQMLALALIATWTIEDAVQSIASATAARAAKVIKK